MAELVAKFPIIQRSDGSMQCLIAGGNIVQWLVHYPSTTVMGDYLLKMRHHTMYDLATIFFKGKKNKTTNPQMAKQ